MGYIFGFDLPGLTMLNLTFDITGVNGVDPASNEAYLNSSSEESTELMSRICCAVS